MTDRAVLERAIIDAREAIEVAGRWPRRLAYIDVDEGTAILAAAQAHLDTLPKTKMVEVWRVEFAQVKSQTLATWEAASAAFSTRAEAHQYAQIVTGWSCTAHIKITGPHQQEIPAT